MNTAGMIEAALFFKAEPMRKKHVAALLEVSLDEVDAAIEELRQTLASRGIVLVENGDRVALATSSEAHGLIERIRKEETETPLSKAASETLAIIVYRGPVSKPSLDYIRGVNSHFILRNLLVRGLIERIPNPEDARSHLYRPSFDLLATLGIENVSQMPEYESFTSEIDEALTQGGEDSAGANDTNEHPSS